MSLLISTCTYILIFNYFPCNTVSNYNYHSVYLYYLVIYTTLNPTVILDQFMKPH